MEAVRSPLRFQAFILQFGQLNAPYDEMIPGGCDGSPYRFTFAVGPNGAGNSNMIRLLTICQRAIEARRGLMMSTGF